MTNDLRKRVARAIAKVDFLREQHSGFIGQSHTFDDDWTASVHYEMAKDAIAEMEHHAQAEMKAALEAVKREARNEGLREAAIEAEDVAQARLGDERETARACRGHILELMGDTDDE